MVGDNGGVSAQTPEPDPEQPSRSASGESEPESPVPEPAETSASGQEPTTSTPSAADGTVGTGAYRTGTASRRLLMLLFGIAAVSLAFDVLTKVVAVARLEDEPPVRLLGGAVYLVLVRNPGAAFSLATGLTWLLALLAIVVVGVIVWLAPKLRSTGWAVGLGLVLGGACGNLVDRLFREPGPLQGHVVDFLSLFAPDGSVWPVFNVADSAIVCGGALVVLMSLLGRDYDGTIHPPKRKRAKGEAGEEK